MAPAIQHEAIGVDSQQQAPRPRGRPRKVQPEIDHSLPLHPWASQAILAPRQSKQTASPSTSYASIPKAAPQPPKQPQQYYEQYQQHYASTSMAPPAIVPYVPQPAPQQTHAYARPSATPAPEPRYYAPVAATRQKAPTRADLDFLLGGSSSRARSSTPNAAAAAASAARAQAAHEAKLRALRNEINNRPLVGGRVLTGAQINAQIRAGEEEYAAAVAAGPDGALTKSKTSRRKSGLDPATFAEVRAKLIAADRGKSVSRTFPGDEDDDEVDGGGYDDGLALGAEAVMESEHDDAESSLSSDPEEDGGGEGKDDPRDGDFQLPPHLRRQARSASDAVAGDASASTPPPQTTSTATARRRPGRPSLASSSGAKVAGSPSPSSGAVDVNKRRGRPRKEEYTPDVLEKIRAANEILAAANLASSAEPGERGPLKKPRLDEIIDKETRKALSPEMRAVILRARNTQLQKERRARIKMEQARAAGVSGKLRGRGRPPGPGKAKREAAAAAKKAEEEARERARGDKEKDGAEGSSVGIVERARGKVSEWMKSLSSEPEASVTDVAADASISRKRLAAATGAVAPGSRDEDTSAIDPRLQTEREDEDKLVEGYFSRFGTVTGKSTPTSTAAAATAAYGDGKQPDSGAVADKAKPAYDAGTLGDEYYFSN